MRSSLTSVVVLVAFAAVAHAERRTNLLDTTPRSTACPPRSKTTWTRLGTRIMYGALPVDGDSMTAIAIGVSLDRPLAGHWRGLAEYEYLRLEGDRGHRAQVGVRVRLAEHRWAYRRKAVALDAEAGGGVMLVDHEPTGVIAEPHGFVGARGVLGSVGRRRLWEYEVVVRGIASPGGPGVLLGIGLIWGT